MAPNINSRTKSGHNNLTANTAANNGVILGPDLNPTKSLMDKKLYRHITLPNGLKCVLICDTVAMRQRKLEGQYEFDSESDDSDDESSDSTEMKMDNDDDDSETRDDKSENNGLRKAATALSVNVGSYHDPPHLQGLSHFLEHMLFLGTETFPGDNVYDAFLSQNGGNDNAYTDMECTLYHYCIPQDGSDGEKNVWKALEMFASFFTCPLLGGEQAERELKAVESEFELNKGDDDNRLSQVMSYTCGMDGNAPIMGKVYSEKGEAEKPFHPFAKFAWGNETSLKTEPESKGVDVMKELRDYYHTHYYAKNMRLVVMAGYELDEIQNRVLRYFSSVPSDPRLPSPTYDSKSEKNCITNLQPYKLPFHPSSLNKVYRIVPVKDRHTLTLTWQIPSMCPYWRTKPADYLGHLLGHEASGSILSSLKHRGWAMGCSAGTGEDGQGDASTHALFMFQVSLSKAGVECWEEVVKVVFAYIGMLRFHFQAGYIDEKGKKVEGLAPWIYHELKSIASLSYKYDDEGDVTDIVEEIAESMCPWYNLPDERLLDGESLLFDDVVENSVVKDLLFNYMTPDNTRVDLMSSLFGRDGDDETNKPTDEYDDISAQDNGDRPAFDKENAGPPMIEPRFGTKFWVATLSTDTLRHWSHAATPQLPSPELLLDLPPQNPFIPTRLDLKPLPEDDASHPLLNCSVKVCITVGKKKSWFPAAVTQYKIQKDNSSGIHRLLLSYEDEDAKWHILDSPNDKPLTDDALLEPGCEGTLDKGKIKFRVIAVPRQGEGAVLRYGDADHDDDVDDGVAFPPIPPPAPVSRLPRLIHDKHCLKVWHLQDRKFKRPVADLRIRVECEGVGDSALNQACLELFCRLCADALVETCYLASTSELGSSISASDTGFSIRVYGFDCKLLTLAKVVLDVVTSFRGRHSDGSLPATVKDGRFDACLETLLRSYRNSGMKSSAFVTSLRLLCLRPSIRSPTSKLKALESIDVSTFSSVMKKMLNRMSIEALYHGNALHKDAEEAARIINDSITRNYKHEGIPKRNLPTKLVVNAPQAVDYCDIVTSSQDPKDPNTAVEVYFQIGKDNLLDRCLVDLIAHILDEPFYAELRTKQQLGYSVSCGARWTYGVIGISFKVVTSVKSSMEVRERIDNFLEQYRLELMTMSNETYMEHLVGLAKNKLEMFDSLEDECDNHWSEIIEGRYDFECHREEVNCLRSITKERLIEAYNSWLAPVCDKGLRNKRRGMAFHVIGSGDGDVSNGRPLKDSLKPVGEQVDDLVAHFHADTKDTWGRIAFGASSLQRANTDLY
eukprot:CCRYP_015887-RA/>CCRYP_015887-RA protein AED:0.05 eAED:0.05 QI:160/1/1/1/1/1/6/125/1294